MEKLDPIYHYDKIRINFKKPKEELGRLISDEHQKELKGSCNWWTGIAEPSATARGWGYGSRIEATVPFPRFFEILNAYGTALGDYSISYLELTIDIFPHTEEEALYLTDFFQKHAIRKYARRQHLYEHGIDEDIDADPTLYIGGKSSKSVKHVAYQRVSKPTRLMGSPMHCLHREWRLTGATLVKRCTGIATIHDLHDFSIQKWINEQMDKYIFFGEINHEKHGRFLQGMSRWAKKAVCRGRGKKQVRLFEPIPASRIFCRIKKINNAGELLTHYKEEQKQIKSKRGRRTEGEEKILSLTPSKLKSFIKPI